MATQNPAITHLLRLLETVPMAPPGMDNGPICGEYLALAKSVVSRPNSPETTVALRLLLDSRDAALRLCSWSVG